MACRSMGAGIIVCGPRGRARKCAYCSRPSSALCDFVVSEDQLQVGGKIVSTSPNTCDKPICGQCARHTEPDTDVCRIHPIDPHGTAAP
jgi:hypothetical protein